MKHKIEGYRLTHWVDDQMVYEEFFRTLKEAQDEADQYTWNDYEYTIIDGYFFDQDNDTVYVDLDDINNDIYEDKQ